MKFNKAPLLLIASTWNLCKCGECTKCTSS